LRPEHHALAESLRRDFTVAFFDLDADGAA
jgi:hypothetical protein